MTIGDKLEQMIEAREKLVNQCVEAQDYVEAALHQEHLEAIKKVYFTLLSVIDIEL